MIRATARFAAASFAALAGLLSASTAAAAPTQLITNGIPSFPSGLGTLLSVQVVLDPPPQSTEPVSQTFDTIGGHNHLVNPLPVVVPGLDTYDFVTVSTSFVNPGFNSDHTHTFDLLPIVETYSGPDLAWFLDPANGVGSLNVIVPPTSPNEGHQHLVNLPPVLPQTTFNYVPVPEPTGLILLAAAAPTLLRRRSRVTRY